MLTFLLPFPPGQKSDNPLELVQVTPSLPLPPPSFALHPVSWTSKSLLSVSLVSPGFGEFSSFQPTPNPIPPSSQAPTFNANFGAFQNTTTAPQQQVREIRDMV